MLRSVAARLVIVARRAAHLPAVSLKGSVEPVAPTYIQSNILCRASSSLGWVSRTSTLLSAVAHKTDAPGTDLTEEYEHATGLEKEEIEAQLEGKSRFEMAPPRGPFGTKEEPAIVESQFDERIVGCSGGVDDDEHDVVWFKLKKDADHECPVCTQYFQLKVVGEGGMPGAHH